MARKSVNLTVRVSAEAAEEIAKGSERQGLWKPNRAHQSSHQTRTFRQIRTQRCRAAHCFELRPTIA
jgi:hypothetical protein